MSVRTIPIRRIVHFAIILPILFLPFLDISIEGKEEGASSFDLLMEVGVEPEVWLEMPSSAEVMVYPRSDCKVTLKGKAYCEMPSGTPPGPECILILEADAGGMKVSYLHPILTFDYMTTEQDFWITVQAYVGLSAEETYHLVVGGYWRYEHLAQEGDVEPVTTEIRAIPYIDLIIGSDDPIIRRPVGSWGEARLVLRNEGNIRDNVTFNLSYPSNIEVEMLPGPVITVLRGSTSVFIIRARQKTGMQGSSEIVLEAKGNYDFFKAQTDYSVWVASSISPTAMISSPVLILTGAFIILFFIAVAFVIMKVIKVRSGKARRER